MTEDRLIDAVRSLASDTNARLGSAEWYIFGSAHDNLSNALDVDILVVCETHDMADSIRQMVDLDQLARPIHLSILTRAEEIEVHFVERQGCVRFV